MQKFRAACTSNDRLHVVAYDDHEIVNLVVAPYSFGSGGVR
jgi:hypothetical protein